MADEVLCAIADGIATVTLNRPTRRNAMNAALLDALDAVITTVEREPAVRVIVVRAAGTAFSAGMDLRELAAAQDGPDDPERGVVDVLRRIETCRHATIAMVQGEAFAGGCQLALHCDLRVAADVARFAMPLTRIGLVVPFALGQKLVEIAGPALAREMLLTGRPVTAQRAWQVGMVHEVVPLGELETVAYEIARTIARNAPLAVAGMKATILRALSAREQVDHAAIDALAARVRMSADAHEGVAAMLEKRTPAFRGE